MLHSDSLTPQTLGKSLEEVAAIVHAAIMAPAENDSFTVISQFEWLRDSHHDWTREEIRSHATNSYINRKLLDIGLYSVSEWAYKIITEKERTKFRAELRRLFQIDLDKVLDEGAKIPQSEIDDALELLKKAGYIAFQLPDDQYINNEFSERWIDTAPLSNGEHNAVRDELQDVDTMSYNLQEWVANAIENVIDAREEE